MVKRPTFCRCGLLLFLSTASLVFVAFNADFKQCQEESRIARASTNSGGSASYSGIFPRKGEKILVGRLLSMTRSQLGNQMFELLSFQSIAKQMKRKPVFVFGDSFTRSAHKNFWNSLLHFPKVVEGIEIVYDDKFFKNNWTQIKVPCYNCYFDATQEAEKHANEDVIIVYGEYLQNYKYLDNLELDVVREKLSYPHPSEIFARNIVAQRFHSFQHRLCVHSRRTDFITLGHQFTDEKSIIPKMREITSGKEASYGIVQFTDDKKFIQKLMETKEYELYRNNTFLPMDGSTHLIWLFMRDHCTHIFLSASTSTFGFFGAYLAGERAKIYYNPAVGKSGKRDFTFPPTWEELK